MPLEETDTQETVDPSADTVRLTGEPGVEGGERPAPDVFAFKMPGAKPVEINVPQDLMDDGTDDVGLILIRNMIRAEYGDHPDEGMIATLRMGVVDCIRDVTSRVSRDARLIAGGKLPVEGARTYTLFDQSKGPRRGDKGDFAHHLAWVLAASQLPDPGDKIHRSISVNGRAGDETYVFVTATRPRFQGEKVVLANRVREIGDQNKAVVSFHLLTPTQWMELKPS